MAACTIDCPVCGKSFNTFVINSHVNKCINSIEEELDEVKSPLKQAPALYEVSRQKKRKKCEDHTDSLLMSPSLPEPTRTPNSPASSSPKGSPSHDTTSSSTVTKASASAWAAFGFNMKVPSASVSEKSPLNKIGKNIRTPSKATSRNSGTSAVLSKPKQSPSPAPGTSRGMTSGNSINVTNETLEVPVKKNLFGIGNTDKDPFTKKTDRTYDKPLAETMRPTCIAEYVGQEQVLGKEKLLRTLVEAHRIPSMILWGPPGCGKTTLARIIANRCKESHNTRFVALSATTSGVNDVKEVVKVARNEKKFSKRTTILFIDEIHRFNKLQQDTFLPHVEDGTIILMGATTENPSFHVNNALLSRCRAISLEKLSVENVMKILHRSLETLDVQTRPAVLSGRETGILIEEAALTTLAQLCDGDARAALTSLQLAVSSRATVLQQSGSSPSIVTVDDVKEGLLKSHISYDRAGEDHYNCASALQKSIRGSDENAAIYWFSRMIEGGEDPRFIARRLVVTASEDIGLADPHALPLAVSAMQAVQLVGLPECSINLAHCVAYLAKAPKSNDAYMAMKKARQKITECKGPQPGVPLHLRNAPTSLMKKMGYGEGYQYSHSHPAASRDQTYLPSALLGVNFFPPSSR